MRKTLIVTVVLTMSILAGCANSTAVDGNSSAQSAGSTQSGTATTQSAQKSADAGYTAEIKINAAGAVTVTAAQTYDYGNGVRAALSCDVYYKTDGSNKKIGSVQGIEGAGTAYPLTYDESGIYAASSHSVNRYEVDNKTGTLKLAESAEEKFDKEGSASYTNKSDGQAVTITQEEYREIYNRYKKGTVINFAK